MIDQAKAALIPPRPNLGPEPLAEPGSVPFVSLAVLVVVLVGSAIASALIRRRIRRRLAMGREVGGGHSASDGAATPGDRLVALSPSIRAALTRRFGPTYLAKTTEELAADARVGDLLGQADFADLIVILNAIDRLKFASILIPDDGIGMADEVAAWESSVVRLTKALDSRPSEKAADRGPARAYRPTISPRLKVTPNTSV